MIRARIGCEGLQNGRKEYGRFWERSARDKK
jgi:hypothetical protein